MKLKFLKMKILEKSVSLKKMKKLFFVGLT